MMNVRKIKVKFYPILLNGLRSILNPLLTIIFSYVIVNYFSKDLWGNFVEYLLLFFIVSLFINWGSKTYLMRAFSQNPKHITKDWQQLFIARLPLCLLCVVFIFLFYQLQIALYIILWVLSAFVYMSLFPVIFYNRDYIKLIWVETIGFIVLLSLIYIQREHIDSYILLKSYAIHVLVKAIIVLLMYRLFFNFKSFRFNKNLLFVSFPFFVLGITGFLQSKVDVYVYSFFYNGKPLGEYQIISGFFIFSQSIVTIGLFPYLKNIYRMPSNSILKLKRLIIKFGLIIHLIIIVSIYYLLLYFFEIKLTLLQITIGFFIGFPSYIYSIQIFYFFKKKKEKTVVITSSVCLLINLILSLVFLNLNFNFTGVLLANAIAQICCVLYYLQLKINA